MPVKLCICGGGNGAHVYAGIASAQADVEARVLTLYADEAERWTKAMAEGPFEVDVHDHGYDEKLSSKPSLVTKDPKLAMEGADLVVFMVPAFAHVQYLEALKPHLKAGQILVGLPGQAGFEFAVYGILGDVARSLVVMNFESLPWACRMDEFGRRATVLGTKESLLGAMQANQCKPERDPLEVLQATVGKHNPKFILQGHLLGITLMSPNGYLHPAILYGHWVEWDGKPIEKAPLFYNGITENTANLLSSVSNEIVEASRKAMAHRKGVDLTTTTPMRDWYLRCYDHDITDKTNLYTCIQTNKAYAGLTHPCIETDGKFMPNFKYRYLTEDIPFGLTVARDIAHICGVPTPNMDKIITWAQKTMGKEYLVDGELKGKDAAQCRIPSRYGFTTIDGLLDL